MANRMQCIRVAKLLETGANVTFVDVHPRLRLAGNWGELDALRPWTQVNFRPRNNRVYAVMTNETEIAALLEEVLPFLDGFKPAAEALLDFIRATNSQELMLAMTRAQVAMVNLRKEDDE